MRIDIMEFKPKNSKTKVIAIVVLAILFIAFFSVLGINYAKLYKANLIAQKKMEDKQNIKISNKIENSQIKKEEITENIEEQNQNNSDMLLPVYTNKSKEAMKNIYNNDSKVAYLTFDDGPSQAVTPLILDVLKEENIKATFFVLGTNVKKNPDILKRAYEEGHYIANHGYSHSYSKIYKNAKAVLEEYNKTEKLIQKAIQNDRYHSYLFRFPGGYTGGKYEKVKKEAGKLLNENNISYLDWNALSGDAEGANTKEKIIKNIEKNIKDKGTIVVLMHDSSSKILTYETLKEVINYLRNQGYTFDNFYSIMQ